MLDKRFLLLEKNHNYGNKVIVEFKLDRRAKQRLRRTWRWSSRS